MINTYPFATQGIYNVSPIHIDGHFVEIQNVKNGDYIRRKLNSKKTYIKGAYNRDMKAYECQNFDDISDYIYIKKGKEVFINFEF